MLTGRPPFTDDDAIVVMARHIKTAPPSFAAAAPGLKIAPEIETLVMRLLTKDPGGRPANAEALLGEMSRLGESGMSITSGVRASLSALPPVAETAPGEAGQSLSVQTSPSPATLELLGGPRRTSWAIVCIIALAVCGMTAFAARQVLESRRAAAASLAAPVLTQKPAEPTETPQPGAHAAETPASSSSASTHPVGRPRTWSVLDACGARPTARWAKWWAASRPCAKPWSLAR